MESKRLYRSKTNRMIAGVCGGLAEHFNIDPTIVRIIIIALAIAGGPGILIYILLWIVVPEEGETSPPGPIAPAPPTSPPAGE
jgi:phage shock protein C